MMMLKNPMVRALLMGLTALYILGVIPMLTRDVKVLLANPIVQVVALLGIIQVSYHDLPLALLLALALVLSVHFSNFLDLGDLLRGGRSGLHPEGDQWNDPAQGDEPMGYNMDKYCNNNWEFQCEGVNTFGRQYNTQGLNAIQGHSVSHDYSSADF